MKIEKIYIGGWFQRTMLHLTELYSFLKNGETQLKLDKKKLLVYREALNLDSIHSGVDGFEFIEFTTADGISVKILEDGLIVLSSKVKDDKSFSTDIDSLAKYYEEKLSPAISYIFSLGAPVPKELANIKTVYPYFIVLDNAPKAYINDLLSQIDEQHYHEYENKDFEVLRSDKYYFINHRQKSAGKIERYIEERIFAREFKGQLHHYLDLHRIIWEKIADVKEKSKVRGKDIVEFSGKIDEYAKTVNLVDSRINQMSTYLHTREKIAKSDPELTHFLDAMEYRYETMGDTLAYIQQIWIMTTNYVNSAKALFSDLQQEVTQKSVDNLTIVTSMGVGASLIGLFAATEMPEFTVFGVFYFFALAIVGFAVNKLLKYIGANRKYAIADKDYEKIK